jgi:phosphatidylcholine synthase
VEHYSRTFSTSRFILSLPAHTTTTYAPPPDVSRAQRGRAWAVHAFTTLGIVAAMLALRDVLTGHPDYAIAWMLLTLLIDGVDGPIARALEVEARVPRIDGFMLDLIIDYVTCVVVPACFMYEFKVVPQNNYGIAVLCVMVFTSAIWFARKDMMTDDNWFRGFPAAWNIMAPVMFLLEARTWVGSAITLVLSAASLTNMPFPHIARARWMRAWTIAGATCWIGGVAIGTIAYPHHYYFVRVMLDIGSVYFVLLACLRVVHDRKQRELAGRA